MVSATEGWAVGRNGVILRYDGSSWQQVTSPITGYAYHLTAISMLDSQNGRIVGDGGVILSLKAKQAPISTPTSTLTPIPTNTPTPTITPTPTNTPTPTPIPPDDYEPDDSCAQAGMIPSDGTIQTRSFHDQADDDWVRFEVTQGMTYTIEARVPPSSRADLMVEVSEGCNRLPELQAHVFTPDVRYEVVAESDGQVYVHLFNEDALVYGGDVTYDLSVRVEDGQTQHGALIIVAGKYTNDDPVQGNIHHVTNEVYKLFRTQGHPAEQIYYLATEPLDANGDGTSDVDQFATSSNLQAAITTWAPQYVGPNQALTLFMMDHGSYDKLYLDETRRERVLPGELDSWLNELEAKTGAKVNVIIEACQSGSFIDPDENLNKEGRVIITASDALAPTFASESGAVFSDALLSALMQRKTLQVAFDEARWATEQHPYAKTQRPLLNSDGNHRPNQPSDEAEAARRGFAISGSFADDPREQWAPYIRDAEIRHFAGAKGQIWADVLDDQGVDDLHVWAMVYPPSYEPPTSSEEIVPAVRRLSLAELSGTEAQYGAEYDAYRFFNEAGEYRIVIYAKDDDGLVARPKEIVLQTGWELYLPLLLR